METDSLPKHSITTDDFTVFRQLLREEIDRLEEEIFSNPQGSQRWTNTVKNRSELLEVLARNP